jgi:hypothetical protein
MLLGDRVGFNGRCAAIAIACFFAPLAHGQTREADAAKNACSPIIAAAVTSQTSIDRQQFDSDATTSWLCSEDFSSEEEASQAGIDISGVIKGVRIGLLYSSDLQRRAQSRSALCTAQQVSSGSAYRLLLTEVTKDANASRNYWSCVRNVIESGKDLACYFEPVTGAQTDSQSLRVIYRPAGVRVGKLSRAQLVGATLEGGGDVLDRIKARQPRPYDPSRPLSAFALTAPIIRDGSSGASFEMSLDDGTECAPKLESVPATLKVRITAIGSALSRTEGRHSYRVDRMGGCGSDDTSTFEEVFPQGTLAVSGQDWRSQLYTRSSNCPRNESGVTDLRIGAAADRAEITFRLKGCGFDWLRICRGRGWVDQYGFIRTRSVDPSQPQASSHTEFHEFASGRVEITQARFKQGLEPDFMLEDFEVTVEGVVPDGAGKPPRRFSLRGLAKSPSRTQQCYEWGAGGSKQYVAFVFAGSGSLVTIFQQAGSCESFQGKGAAISNNIRDVSPDAVCEQRLDGSPRFPAGVPSDKLTGGQVFRQQVDCRR